LGRYEVLRVIGKGAMGVVYEGRDPNLDRRVAIKTVKVENLSEEAAAEYEHRFRTEARSAARLQHPNIVSVYDSDRHGDVAFLVMEFIQGDDLKHHLDRGVRYSLEQSLKIVRDLLSALDYAHKQGIVHRDVKPANLLIEPAGRVKLTDFGVARIQDSGEATRTQGSMVGTLKYMAPEQVQGQKIDARADLFSAGVVLYQLLTDKRPFDGDNDFSIIHQIIGQEPPTPSSINPKLPPALDAVVARALAKDREKRFATARDFAVALQSAFRRAEDQTVVPPPNPNKRVEPAPSRPLTAPGSVPGSVPGGLTTPSVGAATVTQELELVYWKDVKDATDPEELQGFLERFPAGIYADLARRRLRKLAGGEQTVLAATQPGTGAGAFGASVFPNSVFPNEPSVLPTEPLAAAGAVDLRPASWIDEEYTKTIAQPPEGLHAAGAVGTGTAVATPALAEVAPAAAAPRAAVPQPVKSDVALAADLGRSDAAPVARKKPPVAALAGVGLLALAGVVAALVMGRGSAPSAAPPVGAQTAAAPATASATAPPPAAVAPTAPPPKPVVAAAPAEGAAPAEPKEQKTEHAAPAHKPAAKVAKVKHAAAHPNASEVPGGAVLPPPTRVEPAPAPVRPGNGVAAVALANYEAVEQCRERVFLSRQLCLTDRCDKPGARRHPLCVKFREDARMREQSAVPR
jgi:eukaryotic-like serine/threonine-protein kinase